MVEKKEKLELLLNRRLIYMSGFGGLTNDGKIVDRREYPNAVPIMEYPLFGIPESKKGLEN